MHAYHPASHVKGTLQAVATPRPPALAWDGVPLASVYPLVTTRALARPFTYEVPDGVDAARSSRSASGARVRAAWS